MIRPTTILWMVLWVVAAFGLYMVKYKVQAIRTEVASTEKQLREEKKNLHVLNAEWTFLNRPERLASLSAKYLHLKPMHGQQISDLVNLPYGKGSDKVQAISDDEEAMPETTNKGVTLAHGVTHAQ